MDAADMLKDMMGSRGAHRAQLESFVQVIKDKRPEFEKLTDGLAAFLNDRPNDVVFAALLWTLVASTECMTEEMQRHFLLGMGATLPILAEAFRKGGAEEVHP